MRFLAVSGEENHEHIPTRSAIENEGNEDGTILAKIWKEQKIVTRPPLRDEEFLQRRFEQIVNTIATRFEWHLISFLM